MRLFFALWPDDDLRSKLAPHRLEVMRVCGGRPMLPATLHMTLIYVGEVEQARLADLFAIGDAVTAPAFTYTIDVAACFGKAGVAWLAADRTPQPLVDLQAELLAGAIAAKFSPDPRPFRPHLTVARGISRAVDPWHVTPVQWQVDRFRLVAAKPEEKGVAYETVREWAL
jgi:RNA 2',3'-cyclic 3'-phosphodiesterase